MLPTWVNYLFFKAFNYSDLSAKLGRRALMKSCQCDWLNDFCIFELFDIPFNANDVDQSVLVWDITVTSYIVAMQALRYTSFSFYVFDFLLKICLVYKVCLMCVCDQLVTHTARWLFFNFSVLYYLQKMKFMIRVT